jgi:hypothetical protein
LRAGIKTGAGVAAGMEGGVEALSNQVVEGVEWGGDEGVLGSGEGELRVFSGKTARLSNWAVILDRAGAGSIGISDEFLDGVAASLTGVGVRETTTA